MIEIAVYIICEKKLCRDNLEDKRNDADVIRAQVDWFHILEKYEARKTVLVEKER